MRVLLVGSGGREHALAWALAKSPHCKKLFCAPGNAGIAESAECVDIGAEDIPALTDFAKTQAIDLVVVGPEGPLVKGLADSMQQAGIKVFGPTQAAAQIEGSKGFMKDLCAKYKIPTAAYRRFTEGAPAKAFARLQKPPVVVKADGLAAGKGVVICQSYEEADAAIDGMLSGGDFGEAGQAIVIEQFLDGEELSYFALADGKTMLPLGSAQDYKRAFDGDEGPNTGGMGAYSPAHLMTPSLEEKIIHRIIQPTIAGMAAEGCPFTGVLYAGIMVVRDEPYLIEYNARFGDPECQALMMRLQGDLLEILLAGAEGRLSDLKGKVTWSQSPVLCVVMATKGYPGDYPKNTPIRGLEDASQIRDAFVFHAGTARGKDGGIVSTGGRVLGVTATGDTIAAAQKRAYEAVDKIDWPDGFCRRDIGWRALKAAEEAA
jgi:phosphoribosylamine--glycine ligase